MSKNIKQKNQEYPFNIRDWLDTNMVHLERGIEQDYFNKTKSKDIHYLAILPVNQNKVLWWRESNNVSDLVCQIKLDMCKHPSDLPDNIYSLIIGLLNIDQCRVYLTRSSSRLHANLIYNGLKHYSVF